MTDRFVTVPDSLELPAAVKVPVARLVGPTGAAATPADLGLGDAAVLDVGTIPGTVKAGDWRPAAADVSDSGAAGRALLKAVDTSTQRAMLGVCAHPGPLAGVAITAEGTEPRPLAAIGATVYGTVGAALKSSTDDGLTWAAVQNLPGEPLRLLECSDGEVLLLTALIIRKSVGWAASPATATWTTKITCYQTANFARFSIDGDGTKFIASEYGNTRADSRYVHISTDMGTTWTTVWDTQAEFPATHAESHIHGVCYDPWEDRFWMSEGHGVPIGVRYSDDDGATWHLIPHTGAFAVAAPTVLLATDDGIVCGTDDTPNGILGIRRTESPDTLKVEPVYTFWQPAAAGYGFAQRASRDPKTGVVYIGWRAEYATCRPVIVAGTASSGVLVWDAGVAGTADEVAAVVVTANGVVLADYTAAGVHSHIRAMTGAPGVQYANTGNSAGGTAASGLCVAVGATAAASGTESTALGYGSSASGTNSTAMGHDASAISSGTAAGHAAVASGTSATAVGAAATASGASSSAYGMSAIASGTNSQASGVQALASATASLAIGKSSQATSGNAVSLGEAAVSSGAGADAIGSGAAASGTYSVAVGYQAVSNAHSAVALGRGTSATHGSAVALGTSVATTASNQLAIGPRHLEVVEVTAPGVAVANGARLYAKDNGAGKTQLCVIFATGAEVVLATEA